MLTLTDGATQAIQGLVGDRSGAGLRIFPENTDTDSLRLRLSVAETPQPTDEVVEQSGAQVFLDSALAPLLDGRTLDAHTEGEKVQFSVLD